MDCVAQADSLVQEKVDSLFHEYLTEKSLNTNHLRLNYFPIRYRNNVDLVIYADEVGRNQNYNIVLSNRNGVVKSVNFNSDQEHIVLRNLDVDSDYQVSVKGQDHSGSFVDFESNLGVVSTDTHIGMVSLSDGLYKSIADWSANTNQKVKLSDYLLGIQDGSNNLEIVYFLQNHYKIPYVNRPTAPVNSIVRHFPVWPPDGNDDTSDPHDEDGAETRDDCNCSFVQNTARDINPGDEQMDGSIISKSIVNEKTDPEETWYSLEGKGAAKRMKLTMKGKHGSGKFEASTIGVGTDATDGSPFMTRISYNFVCSEYGTDLPEDCECPKDIWIEYDYTTSIKTSVEKGGGLWIWSKGGEAVAEDHVILMIRNGEDISIEDAGSARLATHCESNWNTEWWTSAASLLAATAGVAIDTNANAASWAGLADDLVDVLSTSFFIGEGDCTDKNRHGVLMSGRKKITMTTNSPVDIIMSSFGYEFVRGYGKWTTKASMVSDYSLSTVLLGQDDVESGCCSHKVADFYTGSFDDVFVILPWPFGTIKVADGSVNDADALADKVSTLFELNAPFSSLERDFKGDYILGEWGHFVEEESDCFTPIDALVGEQPIEIRSTYSNNKFYPNPASDLIFINEDCLQVDIFDMSGRIVKSIMNVKSSETINIADLDVAQYILSIITESSTDRYTFIKIK